MIKIKESFYPYLIALVGIVLFIPFLGAVHLFDWDEINFAESAREMIVTKDYLTVQINYFAFWEKPPLFIWMQVLSMKIFGVNEFAARFPNAIGGIITLVVLYSIGKKLYNARFGILWTLVYAGSLLPHLYFKSGIIDPWFNLFIFLGIYYMISYVDQKVKQKQTINIVLSATFIGLGILTKGPVALLIFGLATLVWLIYSGQWRSVFNFKFFVLYIPILTLVGGFWFILQILDGRSDVLVDFVQYQLRLFKEEDAGHGGFLLYHFVVLFFGVFPASIFALKAFRKFTDDSNLQKLFRNWMMITFWVVLILFTIVNTKIVHYSSMCYFPLTYLATFAIYKMINGQLSWPGWAKTLLIIITFLEGSLLILVQVFIHYKDRIIASGAIKDDFAVANMQAEVHWSGFEFLIGVLLIAGILFSIFYYKKNIALQVTGVFISSLLFTSLTMLIIVPKVEQYSQNAAIEFYENISSEDCYVQTWGYKSYAQYFYAKKPQPEDSRSQDLEWLLSGNVDKTVYIVTKNIRESKFTKENPNFSRLYEKNGFVFFVRSE
ncbi:MAG: glycosyltransferase family 39 protein [Bacteroidales bacterium]|nr:glycosyltransferase family 39 protein [Bacteroidales bacterium]